MSNKLVKTIKIADFDYPLPDERIARHPIAKRDACKLIVSHPDGKISHNLFSDLPSLLPENSMLVCNNTRVINARISFQKETGSRIEIFLLEPVLPKDYVVMFQAKGRCRWSCLVGNLKRWKSMPLEKKLSFDGKEINLRAERFQPCPGNAHEIEFSWDDEEITFATIIEKAGYIPIPPYLKRDSEESDSDDYQTVYARIKGSVAAPTAGLHFTPEVFDAIAKRGIETYPLTLHVGAGTFQPVKSEEIGEHPMHTETFSVDRRLIDALINAKYNGQKIVAVGTTSVRTLESLPYLGAALAAGYRSLYVDQWSPYDENSPAATIDTIEALQGILRYMDENATDTVTAATSIMIAPGFKWRIADVLITNFHQPQSTLLLLVSSFLEPEMAGPSIEATPRWRELYDEALERDYRFLSYGDACLLFPLSGE